MWQHWQDEAVIAQGKLAEFERYDWNIILATANQNVDKARAQVADLTAQVEKLKSDGAMLDWLEANNKDLICWHAGKLWLVGETPSDDVTGNSPRAAITAAMEVSK